MLRNRPAVVCGMLMLIAATAAAGRSHDDRWIRGVYIGSSPRPVLAAEEKAWHQASALAELTPDAFVLVGSGRSMEPLYGPDTILVLRHLPFNELKRGQTVLYLNRERKVIAHVLVTKTRDGWRVQGLNNPLHDMEPVRADNLVGIVVAAFSPVPEGRQSALLR